MYLGLNNKKALVTGGSKGIGREITKILRNEGALVDIISRTSGIIMDLEKELPKKLEYEILINNFGGGGSWGDNFEEFNEWNKVYQKNAGIAIKLTQMALNYMKKVGYGRIITISSIYGKEKGEKPWFVMAKANEIALNKCLAGKYPGITFNTICPGFIDTGKLFDYPKETCIKPGEPKDVANLVVFLCSERANYINGACITVDGGQSHSF